MADVRDEINRNATEIARVLQDAAYVAVGLGVIGFQRAQVARRGVLAQLTRLRDEVLEQLSG